MATRNSTGSAPKHDVLELIDGIDMELENLAGLLGVCRVAAMAEGAAHDALRDADLPDALTAALNLAASIRQRVDQLGSAALAK